MLCDVARDRQTDGVAFVTDRRHPWQKADRNAAMAVEYGRGASLSQLAAKHRISVPRTHRILDREGVDFRPQWWGNVMRSKAFREGVHQ